MTKFVLVGDNHFKTLYFRKVFPSSHLVMFSNAALQVHLTLTAS